ncbi:cysteine hydrolase family protein [Nocardia sp. CC227C]|uniref:cysteine hydrolase family protein n=1 Tax=Nocardia sp. CC227C TaxID=3044562 RepID=UPI00278BEEC7|nr:isochorismatase family cysteine hydrolase [Nocardia sp. CC227C]
MSQGSKRPSLPGDLVLEKTRNSFFVYTELDPILGNLGVRRLLVAGLQTNVCVEATVRAALERNYEVAVAEDVVSTDGPALHHGVLDSMRVLYVKVAPWRELLADGAA